MTLLELIIRPSELKGEIDAPPSKSYTHRAVICAALASGRSVIKRPLYSEDILATLDACKAIGAKVFHASPKEIVIEGVGGKPSIALEEVNCRESGSTARFMLPIFAVSEGSIIVDGKPGLRKRPVKEVIDAMLPLGVSCEYLGNEGRLPLKLSGKLSPGVVKIRGDVSSQYISGLLFALPLLNGDSVIEITTEMQSKDYIDITLDVLRNFGIEIINDDYRRFIVRGNQAYKAREYLVEGDYSSAAFFLAAGALCGNVKVKNLNPSSEQGDKAIVDILKEMGALVEVGEDFVRVGKAPLSAVNVDAKNIPDLVPILSVLASQAEGKTRIYNVERLRIKESNRLDGSIEMVKAFGGNASFDGSAIVIEGPSKLLGCRPETYGDHRFTMSASIAACIAEGETTIKRPTDIKKSYPSFYEHFRLLGGDVMTLQPPLGEAFKVRVYGDSHGRRVGVFIEGAPSGLEVPESFIESELDRRRSKSKLTTPRREEDKPIILSGIAEGKTTGKQIRIEIRNKDKHSRSYEEIKNMVRPGHGDLTAKLKLASVFDYRGGGFLSARLTAPLVAAGAVAKKLLEKKGVKVLAHNVQIGKVRLEKYLSDEELEKNRDSTEVKCADPETAEAMAREVEEARKALDSIGGITECRITGLPVGVGEPRPYALDAMLARAMLAIPAAKGVEFGAGFRAPEMRGSENNDEFVLREGKVVTLTNNSGGVLGGMSNGMPVVFRVAFKPTSSIAREQRSVDLYELREKKLSVRGRHDPCVAVRAPPIVEALASLVVADLMMLGNYI